MVPKLLTVAASENECDLFFEASVAGGIPILRSIVDGLCFRSNYEDHGDCEWNNELYFNENESKWCCL